MEYGLFLEALIPARGLVIYNPPWTLKAALEESLPVLGTLIGSGKEAWKIEET
jgi:23S rRNA A2030 N6-methylase RlmJ